MCKNNSGLIAKTKHSKLQKGLCLNENLVAQPRNEITHKNVMRN